MVALLILLPVLLHPVPASTTPEQLEKIYGSIFVTDNPAFADYHVYVEEADGSGDLKVYKVKSPIYSDGPGLWYFTKDKSESDFVIYFEQESGFADFSISYVKSVIFAGVK